jgi:ribosomal protein L37AE/L43A
MGERWTRRDKGKIYEVCPACGKKGARRKQSGSVCHITMRLLCRYCNYSTVVARYDNGVWIDVIQKDNV